MLALYRSGRQADALEVYRCTRQMLADEFGIEPTTALRDLERAILMQDPSLEPRSASQQVVHSAVLVVPSGDDRLDDLLVIAEPLARRPVRELIIARLLTDSRELQRSSSRLNLRRASLGVPARAATFTTVEPAQDVIRLATSYDVELVLLDHPPDLDATPIPDTLAGILDRSSADVAVLVGCPAVR